MQELTYVNLAGEAVTFGGFPPFVLESVKGTEAAGVDRKTLKAAFQDGARTVSALREDRSVDVTFHLLTYGRSELYRERARLSSVLSVGKGFDRDRGERARIIYQNDYGTWWTWALPGKMPAWPKRIQDIHASVKVSFDCDSPYWFAMEENSGSFESSNEGLKLPFAFPVQFGARNREAALINNGHAPAPLRIAVYGEGEKPTLNNLTTGAQIILVEPIPQGAVLHISTDPEDLYVQLETEEGISNAYGFLDVTTPISDFFLAPGVNQIAYEATGPEAKTRVALSWRDRLEGV